MDAGKDRPVPSTGRRTGRLHGLRVLDLTWNVAGPYATRLLADAGADVIKVERPVLGDPARRSPELMRGRPVFAALNTGKRSITVNLESPEGRLIVLELARWAHVAVENFTPGVMERLGLGMEDFGAANHGLMVCSISSFGPPGPCHDWKATGFTLDAMAGLLPRGNTAGAPPGYHQAELAGGAAAAAAIETSRGSGTGPAVHHLEISVMDAARYRRQGRARSLTPSAAGPQAPALGQHNREVFLGLLGFSPGETVFLRQTGVI